MFHRVPSDAGFGKPTIERFSLGVKSPASQRQLVGGLLERGQEIGLRALGNVERLSRDLATVDGVGEFDFSLRQ